ncbi:MAG TPA: HD domain-containing phosphohydrolase [Victivallales bacterium]|nr:HD domain-containing phosphohydrolase [Victivallales bacterium]
MGSIIIVTLLLIFIGAAIMFMSILKSVKALRYADWFILNSNFKILYLYRFHLLLMFFFLVGYIAVFTTILMKVSIVSLPFIGTIFFFGSVFVFMGIYIYSYMLSICKEKHNSVLLKNSQLIETEDAIIYMLAYQSELRDSETGQHIERTAKVVKLLVEKLAYNPKYAPLITDSYVKNITKSAPLHDIGKISVPDAILQKHGKLSEFEYEEMKKHCVYGAKILNKAKDKISFKSFLPVAVELAYYHHERWDGKGYPRGLQKNEIPLSARIMAVADVYDALVSERYYKPAYSSSKSCSIIENERGKQFDPDVIDAFVTVKDDLEKIYF